VPAATGIEPRCFSLHEWDSTQCPHLRSSMPLQFRCRHTTEGRDRWRQMTFRQSSAEHGVCATLQHSLGVGHQQSSQHVTHHDWLADQLAACGKQERSCSGSGFYMYTLLVRLGRQVSAAA